MPAIYTTNNWGAPQDFAQNGDGLWPWPRESITLGDEFDIHRSMPLELSMCPALSASQLARGNPSNRSIFAKKIRWQPALVERLERPQAGATPARPS